MGHLTLIQPRDDFTWVIQNNARHKGQREDILSFKTDSKFIFLWWCLLQILMLSSHTTKFRHRCSLVYTTWSNKGFRENEGWEFLA